MRGVHASGYCGENIQIALCDTGLSYIVPSQNSNNPNESKFSWDILQNSKSEKKVKDLLFYGDETFPENQDLQTAGHLLYHGRAMASTICATSPESTILPVHIDETAESWINCFNDLAENDSVKIVNVSWPVPGGNLDSPELINTEFKEALINCLESGKIVLLAAGNVDKFIPEIASVKEESTVIDMPEATQSHPFWSSYYSSHRRLGNLFEGEGENSVLFSNLLIVGSSKSNSLEVHQESVKAGNGFAQRQYIYADGDNTRFFFDFQTNPTVWGGTSTATAAASGAIACLWSAAGLSKPGSEVVRALFETADKADDFDPKMGLSDSLCK